MPKVFGLAWCRAICIVLIAAGLSSCGIAPYNVQSLAFSPDGKTLATAEVDSIRLMDVTSGKSLRTLTGVLYPGSIVFRPDGKVLACTSQPIKSEWFIKMWDPATGKELVTISDDDSSNDLFSVRSLAFSPDGKILATGSPSTALLLDPATGKKLRILSGHGYPVAFSPDGKTLAASDGMTLRLWDTATGKELRSVTEPSGYGTSLAFSPDGKMLASGGLGITNQTRGGDASARQSLAQIIILFDPTTGKELRTLSKMGNRVAFSPDGKILATGGNIEGVIKLSDTATGKEIRTLSGLTGLPSCIAFSPSGKFVVAGSHIHERTFAWEPFHRGKTLMLWDTTTGSAHTLLEN